jgi:protein-S-isoprenylcysteine O-methyltransferase Ste14
MKAHLAVAYGLIVYVVFFGTFLYLLGFLGNFAVPKSIDSGAPAPLAEALIVNMALIAAFGVQHSVMARQGFKRWWTKIVPQAIERSTFVLFASLALILLFWQWRPMPSAVWVVDDEVGALALKASFWIGCALVLIATFLFDHFELFGLRQVFAGLKHRSPPPPAFRTPLFYRYVRHPMYLGLLLFFWSTPEMSEGHLLFALGMSGYILIGIRYEERDLIEHFGDEYRRYRAKVGMLLPRLRGDAGSGRPSDSHPSSRDRAEGLGGPKPKPS